MHIYTYTHIHTYTYAHKTNQKDVTRAHRVAASLKAGATWINNYNLTPVELPWGGYKQSGLGRENGLEGIEAYTQHKSVYVESGSVDSPF